MRVIDGDYVGGVGREISSKPRVPRNSCRLPRSSRRPGGRPPRAVAKGGGAQRRVPVTPMSTLEPNEHPNELQM
eukprot:1248062-Pyramimonas_sp.AAC.2